MTGDNSTLYLLPFIAASGLLCVIAVLGFSHLRVTGAREVAILTTVLLVWQLAYILELVSPDLPQKLFWDKLQWMPILAGGTASLGVGLVFGCPRLKKRVLLLLALLPAALFGLALLADGEAGLIYANPMIIEQPPFNELVYDFTTPLAAAMAYALLLIVTSVLLLLRALFCVRGRQRLRIGFIAGGQALGITLYVVLTASGVTFLGQSDISPLSFTLGALVIAWGIWRHRLFDLIPVANEKLFESMRDAVVILDEEDRIVGLNSAARAWMEPADADPIGHSIEVVMPDWETTLAQYRGAVNVETEMRVPSSGRIRSIDLRIEPIRNAEHQLIGRLVIARDVTPAATLLERLRQSEERLRIITDNIHDMVAYMDAQGVILYASPSFAQGLGYERDTLVGRLGFDFIYEEDVSRMQSLLLEATSRGTRYPHVNFRCLHADGHLIWVEASVSLVYNRQEELTGSIVIFRDVSVRLELERARLEQERLHVALQKETELSELKNRMMMRIGHEFRTPLAVIQTSGYLLNQHLDKLSAEQRQHKMRTIQREIQHITDMLDAITDVVNNRLTQQPWHFQTVQMAELCARVVETTRLKHNPGQKITLTVSESPAVCGDYHALQTMLTHILVNAIEYSDPDTAIQMTLAALNGQAVIEVRDAGAGILKDDQKRVFEPFFRGSNIGERSGLGLGLTFAQSVVSAHGGSVTLESEVNRGTTVTVRLPLMTDQS